MAVYYLDTSAVVKRYAQESETAWIMALTDPKAGHNPYTVRLTGPELISALFRKARTGQVLADEAARSARSFRTDWQHPYQIVEVDASVAEQAAELAEMHGLRGYDAIHLTAAVALQDIRQAMRLPPLTFVSSGAQQLQTALNTGFPVEDPNQHP